MIPLQENCNYNRSQLTTCSNHSFFNTVLQAQSDFLTNWDNVLDGGSRGLQTHKQRITTACINRSEVDKSSDTAVLVLLDYTSSNIGGEEASVFYACMSLVDYSSYSYFFLHINSNVCL